MIINEYLLNPSNYVYPFEIKEKKKERVIITYKLDEKGELLRQRHKAILSELEKLPSSDYSYAYKKGYCTKDALLPHMNSSFFIKLDIKSFFESITKDKFFSIIEESNIIFDKEKLESCFYEGHLSLGYVTSPKISDLYLYQFDIMMEKYIQLNKGLHYSRYSDDILISSESSDYGSLHTFLSYIKKSFKLFDLEINEKKLREFDINKDTAVSFLGLNLVKKDEKYYISINKKFILKTLNILDELYFLCEERQEIHNELHKYLLESINNKKNKLNNNYAKSQINCLTNKKRGLSRRIINMKSIIYGRVNYIEQNSEITYKKFLKKHINKFGFTWRSKWL